MEKYYAVTDGNLTDTLIVGFRYPTEVYTHPLLAAFLAPVSYSETEKFRLWKLDKFNIEGEDPYNRYYLATWAWSETEVPMPIVTPSQRMEFAIRCWLDAPDPRQPEILQWMDRWLDGDRAVTWTVDGINFTIAGAAMRKRIDFLKIAKEVMRDGNAVE